MQTTTITTMTTKFRLGTIVATPHALELLGNEEMMRAIERHAGGDWGDLSDFDKRANNHAVLHGERILSCYKSGGGVFKFWVITEADRSSTCVLMPEDY